MYLSHLLAEKAIAKGTMEAHRHIELGSIYLNGERVTHPAFKLKDGAHHIERRGRTENHSKHVLVIGDRAYDLIPRKK